MNRTMQDLRNTLEDRQADFEQALSALDTAKAAVEAQERCCGHRHWNEPIRKTKTTPGYHIEGDPPGSMGSDWRGPMDVPPHTEVWWERTCQECGKVQITVQSKPTGAVEPVFPSH